MTGRTLDELAAVTRTRPELLRELLEDERARGRVELIDGRWQATPALTSSTFGRALQDTNPIGPERRTK